MGAGDFVATVPVLSGPLRQPSDSGLLVATPLFKLPPWVPGKFTFSQTTTSASAVVAPSVLWLTAFQLQASKALYVLYTTTEDAGCFPLFVFAFITQVLLIGQNHSQEQLISKHTSTTRICQVWYSECFVLLNAPQCWATFPLISWVVQLDTYASYILFANLFSFPCIVTLQIFCQYFVCSVTELFFSS